MPRYKGTLTASRDVQSKVGGTQIYNVTRKVHDQNQRAHDKSQGGCFRI